MPRAPEHKYEGGRKALCGGKLRALYVRDADGVQRRVGVLCDRCQYVDLRSP